MTARRRVALATTLLLMATAVTAQPPTDRQSPPNPNGRRSIDDLIAQLRALEAGDAEVRKLADQLKGMDPDQLRKLMESFKGMTPPPNVPPGKMPELPNPPPLPAGKDVPPSAPPVTPATIPPAGPPTPDPVPPPQGSPNPMPLPTEKPVQPPTPEPGTTVPPVDPARPPATPETADKKAADSVIAAWEKNIGPLDDSPGIKSALLDMVQSGGLSSDGKSGLADLLGKGAADKDNLPGKSWFDKDSGPGSWKWPDLGVKASDLKLPNGGLSSPDLPSAPSLGDPGSSALGGALAAFLMVAAAVVVGLVVWRFWPAVRRLTGQQTDLRAKPWPFDPRTVTDRAKLVRAFEFLSVSLCGNAARVWNHKAIAAALRTKVAGADPVADELAALYELARYTPADQPLTADEYAAARRALCHLAGVNPA